MRWHHPQAQNPLHAHSFFQQIVSTPGRQASIWDLGIVRRWGKGMVAPSREVNFRPRKRAGSSIAWIRAYQRGVGVLPGGRTLAEQQALQSLRVTPPTKPRPCACLPCPGGSRDDKRQGQTRQHTPRATSGGWA